MSRRPAVITQADVARAIRAAKQAGADRVEVVVRDGVKIIVHITQSTGRQDDLEIEAEIVL